VCVESRSPHRRRGSDSDKRWQRFAAKAGETQVEPDHVRLQCPNAANEADRIAKAIEFPTADDREPLELRLRAGIIVCQNGQFQPGPQL